MQQRVALARALALDPAVLLMDEIPFAALDEITRDRMAFRADAPVACLSQTVLFVTHSCGGRVLLSDRVVLMSARPGRIHQAFEIDLPRPRDRETRPRQSFPTRSSASSIASFTGSWHDRLCDPYARMPGRLDATTDIDSRTAASRRSSRSCPVMRRNTTAGGCFLQRLARARMHILDRHRVLDVGYALHRVVVAAALARAASMMRRLVEMDVFSINRRSRSSRRRPYSGASPGQASARSPRCGVLESNVGRGVETPRMRALRIT